MTIEQRLWRARDLRLELAGLKGQPPQLEDKLITEAFDKTLVGQQLQVRICWLELLLLVENTIKGTRVVRAFAGWRAKRR